VIEEPLLPLATAVVVERELHLREELVAHALDQLAHVHLDLPSVRECALVRGCGEGGE